MNILKIQGAIVDTDLEKESELDVTSKDIADQLEGMNGDIEVEITSPGGSVFEGIKIANTLARYDGNVVTHAVGLVASIATVILMAGKRVVVDENSFICIHNPWTCIQGNANDLKKEIQQLEQCREAMMGFYRKHMKITDEQMIKLLDDETWMLGKEFADIVDCEVLACDQPMKIAASLKKYNFKHLPKAIAMEEKTEPKVDQEIKEAVEKQLDKVEEPLMAEAPEEEIKEETTEIPEEKKEETVETVELTEVDILKARIAELEEELKQYQEEEECKVTKAECEKRVAGMQSTMSKQLDSQKKDYEARINDFTTQLKVRDEELAKFKAEAISLKQELEDSKKELSKVASAFEEKSNALAQLNAGVNTKTEVPTFSEGLARCKNLKERLAFINSKQYK